MAILIIIFILELVNTLLIFCLDSSINKLLLQIADVLNMTK